MKKKQKAKQAMGIFRVVIMCLALAGISQFLMGGCGGSSGSDTPPPNAIQFLLPILKIFNFHLGNSFFCAIFSLI